MSLNAWRATVAAFTFIIMTAGSTAISSMFVVYREAWGLSSADIAIVFTVYVGTLLPTLLLFGNLAERFGRRRVIAGALVSMAVGISILTLAHSLPMLIVARLFQGIAVGLAAGAATAAFTETYSGKLPQGNALQSITAIGLFTGPLLSAVSFHLGTGLNRAFVPGLVLVLAVLAFTRFLAERPVNPVTAQPSDIPFAPDVVNAALRYAMPLVFVSWAGLALYMSLVPSYLAATLHVSNPLIGAGAIVAAQLSSLVATLLIGNVAPQKSGIVASATTVAGVALLVAGTSLNQWVLVVLATMLVGAGGGVASGAAFGIANRVGRGQRTKVFARMYVAAYLGYSLPVLAIGIIAAHASFAAGFISIVVFLGLITAALPFVRNIEAKPVCSQALAPAAA